jgi:hypothetical protein
MVAAQSQAWLLRLLVRISPGMEWISVSCGCCMLSGWAFRFAQKGTVISLFALRDVIYNTGSPDIDGGESCQIS